jgi:hypothetical protein
MTYVAASANLNDFRRLMEMKKAKNWELWS